MWRSVSARAESFAGILALGALWSQPVLVVLIIESALALNWDSTPAGALLPSLPRSAIIGVGLVVGVAALFLAKVFRVGASGIRRGHLGRSSRTEGALVAVEGYDRSREVFATFGVLPTGRSSEVAAIDCPSLTCSCRGGFKHPVRPSAAPIRGRCGSHRTGLQMEDGAVVSPGSERVVESNRRPGRQQHSHVDCLSHRADLPGGRTLVPLSFIEVLLADSAL